MRHHESYSSRSLLPKREGSGTVMRPTTLDPHLSALRGRGGSGTVVCPAALSPASELGSHHVTRGSEPRFSVHMGSRE
jgi:hypothetical protein